MNYSTLDKFEGAWFGSIIGSALANKLDSSDYNKILNYEDRDWIEIRNKIALVVLQNRHKREIQRELESLLENYFYDLLNSYQNASNQASTLFEQIPKTDLINCYCRLMSFLLPLTILQQDNNYVENIYIKAITRSNLNFVSTESIPQDIAAWNHILTMALNSKFMFTEANVAIAIRQILSLIKVKKSSLVEKLKIVSQAWENGLSLQQLISKLYRHENSVEKTIPTASLAIALSFYCFASTPKNFVVSVKRAARIDNNLSPSVALLTATLSGAYNGRTSLPKNWIRAAHRHPSDLLARKTVQKLYQIWSGVYDLDNLKLLCNSEATTIAAPKIFQTRSSLKIISQKSTLD